MRDRNRVQKDEFLHKLSEIHKGDEGGIGQLDLGDMAAGKMLLTGEMEKKGISLTVGETADMLGEMARAIGGKTELAGRQMAVKIHNRDIQRKAIADFQRNKMEAAREMLTRKNRGKQG